MRRFWKEFAAHRQAEQQSAASASIRRKSTELKRKYTVQSVTSGVEFTTTQSSTTEPKSSGKFFGLLLFLVKNAIVQLT